MAYTPTHIALQGLIVWLLISKKNKNYYKEHRWEFILINLFALFPDLDIFFGYHRSYTHSLIIPTFILLSMIIAGKISPSINEIETSKDRVIRFVKLAMLMWILHIFLDFSWGPILIFWPIDLNLYDLSVILRFENKPWLFFPLSLVGIIPNWGIYTITEGERLFFINLSNQERQAIYGQFIDLNIEQITLQVLIFVVWLVVIVFPAFIRKRKKSDKEERKVRIYLRKTWKRIKRQLTVIGLFILFLGLLLGPTIGRDRLISYQVNAEYINTTSFFDPTLGVVFLNKPQTTTNFEFLCETGVVSYNTSIMLSNNATFSYFFESYDNMTQNYYDGNITYQQLLVDYNSEVESVKENSMPLSRLIEDENEEGFSYELNSTDIEEPVYLLAIIDEWNITESFIYDVSIVINYLVHREQARIEGIILDVIGLILIISDQLLLPRIEEKRKSARIEKSAD